MADVPALLAQYLGTQAPSNSASSLLDQKIAAVQAAGVVKQAIIAPNPNMPTADQLARVATANAIERGQRGVTDQMGQDFLSMPRLDFMAKYGDAGQTYLQSEALAASHYKGLTNSTRTWADTAGDTAAGLGLGAFDTVAAIPAAVGGAISPKIGVPMAQSLQHVNQVLQNGLESASLNDRRAASAARTVLDAADNDFQYQTDKASDGDFLAGLKRIGNDFTSTLKEGLSDPQLIGDGASQGVGSMLALGPVSKGFGAVGKLALGGENALTGIRMAAALDQATGTLSAARAVAAGAEHGGMMAATGATMGAGAYQDTVNQVMGRSAEEMNETSPEYRARVAAGEDPTAVQQDLANRAGLMAGAAQGLLATATGGIAARFHEDPLAMKGLGTALTDTGKSTLEMGAQSVTGALAQNQAMRQSGVDPNQDLSEGVGSALGSGVLNALTTAGAIQAPGLAGHAAAEAVGAGVRRVGDAVNARAEQVQNDLAKKSPVAPDQVQAGVEQAAEQAPGVLDQVEAQQDPNALPSGALRPRDQIMAVLHNDPADAANQSSPLVRSAIEQAPGRFQALEAVSKIAGDKSADPQDRIAAGFYLKDTLNKIRGVTDTALPEMLRALPEDHPAVEAVHDIGSKVADLGDHFENSPEIAKAIKGSLDLAGRSQPGEITEDDLHTPKGQQAAHNVLKLAEHAPEKVNPDLADQILAHAQQGRLQLTDDQKGILLAASSFAQANQEKIQQAKALGVKTNSLVSHEIQDGQGDKGPSGKDHLLGVLSAIKAGDTALARDRLEQFMQFAQHMNNKVEALNQSLAQGGTNQRNAVPFHALKANSGDWYQSSHWFNPSVAKSVETAQMAALDARAVTKLANSLSEAFPKLGVEPVKGMELSDPKILTEPATDVAQRYQADPAMKALRQQNLQSDVVGSTREIPTQSNSVSEEPTVSEPSVEVPGEATPAEQTAETQSEEVDPQELPTTEVETGPQKSALENAYPELIGSRDGEPANWFTKAFSLPAEAKSRLVGLGEAAASTIYEALVNLSKFEHMAGEEQSHRLTAQVSAAYDKYLPAMLGLKTTLDARLAKALDAKYYGITLGRSLLGETTQKANGEEAYPANRLLRGKIFNLTEVRDGQIQYNDELQQGALLAGMQWLLSSDARTRELDQSDVADILGKDAGDVTAEEIAVFNLGQSRDEAVQSLAAQITRFWGVSANADVPEGYTKGIAQGMAKEVLQAMHQAGLVQLHDDIKIGDKAYPRVETRLEQNFDARTRKGLKSFPTALEHLVLTEPGEIRYIDEPPTQVSKTQLRNGAIQNTAQQLQVLEHVQKTPHFLNKVTVAFAQALGSDLLLKLFGQGNPNTEGWNDNYRRSVEGYNRTVTGAFEALNDTLNELDVRSTRDAPMFYRYEFNRVNRLQMEGSFNPQASKLMREWILPTRATVDLTQQADLDKFHLALAQAWGVKIHKDGVALSVQKAKDLAKGPLATSLSMLAAHLRNPTWSMDDSHVAQFKQDFGDRLSPVALHAALEYARFQQATPEQRKAFTTQLYVEADGVTDGVINALQHYSTDRFSAQWVRLMAKGGLYFDRGRTLAIHTQGDSADIYQTTKDGFDNLLHGAFEEASGPVKAQMTALLRVMNHLLPNVDFDAGTGDDLGRLDLNRGVIKNPLTVTVYGSGAKGIASKIAGEMIGELYKARSLGHNGGPALDADLDRLTTSIIGNGDDGLYVANRRGSTDTNTGEGDKYTLTPGMIDNLTRNIQHLFVGPMREAMSNEIGGVTAATTALRRAVQVMGIVQHDAYVKAYEAALADRRANDPNWKPGDGLSQKELTALLAKTMPLGPLVDTGTQAIYPAGSANSQVKGGELSEDVLGKFGTPNYIQGPIDPGVRGIAFLNIAPGDGQMIQNILTLDHAPQGGLPVFDGFHMKLDTMEKDSQAINEAVRQGWLANPLDAVQRSYGQFLEYAQLDQLSEEARVKVAKALDLQGDEDFDTAVKGLHGFLQELTREAEIRHQVLGEVATSTDHMAGAEAPFQSEGHDVSGEPHETAQKLNDLYDQKKAELEAKDQEQAGELKAPGAPASSETDHLGTPDPKTGVRVVEAQGFEQLAQELNIPEANKPLVGQLVRSLAQTGYRLVLGAPEQIRAWAQANDRRLLGDRQVDGDVVHGYTVIGDKMIYLNHPSSETMVHELIHAATLEKVFAYYDNPKSLSRDQRAAVKRLEVLMNEWRGKSEDLSGLDRDTQNSYQDALAAVEGHLNNTSVTDSIRKANALNEFMAWNLANTHLSEANKQTRVSSDWRKWGRRILQAIRQLVWAKPEGVPHNLDAALRFDTSVLLDGAPSIQAQMSENLLFHSTQYGSDDRLDKLDQDFARQITASVDDEPNAVALERAQGRVMADAMQKSTEVVEHFQDAGFEMTPQQISSIRLLVGAFVAGAQLDPPALARLHELHSHAIQHLDTAHFMDDPHSQDPREQALANTKLHAVLGNDLALRNAQGELLLKDSHDRSLMLPAFLAMAMVHPELRDALAQIDTPKLAKTDAKTVDGWAEDMGEQMMQSLSLALSGEGRHQPNAQAAIDALTARLADSAQTKRDYIAQNTNALSRLVSDINDRLVDLVQLASGKAYDALDQAATQTASPAIRGLLEAGKLVTSVVNEQRSSIAAEGVISLLNRSGAWEGFHSFVNDLIGRTTSNAPVYDMIKEVRTFVARARQQFREHLPVLLAGKFTQGLSEEDSTHAFKAMGKSDLASLMPAMSRDQVLDLLQNHEQLEGHIAEHERLIQQLAPSDGTLMIQKARQLARWLNTGEWGRNLLANAENIARLNGERKAPLQGEPSRQLIEAIDRLTTFHALDGLSDETKARMANLAEHERQGVGFLLDYLSGQRKDEQAKLTSDAARINHYKGYIPSEKQEGLNLVVADDREHSAMVSRGYRRVADYHGSRAEIGKPKRGYYFSSLGQSVFDQGILQNVRATASGVDPVRGYSYGHVNTAGRITDPNQVRQLALSQRHDTGAEPLRAIYDAKGKPVAYERMLDPDQEARLQRSTDLAKMIGVWRGRQAEEAMAGEFNNRLIDALADMWKSGKGAGKDDEFVNLLETHKLDTVTRDAVSLFTPETLHYVAQAFGGQGFMVRKDLLNDTIGYRQPSVRDAWTGVTRWSPEQTEGFRKIATSVFGAEAYKTLVNAEKFYQGVLNQAKDNIIVKSVVVPVSNVLANLYQLTARGVPLKAMINGTGAKTAEIHGYVQRSLRAIDLEAELRASSNDILRSNKLRAELQAISDTDRRMSIWPLIQAGEFSTIAEDLAKSDEKLFKGKLFDHMRDMVSAMPESLQTAGRYALVTHDTALYKGLEKSVAYGDFIAKAILYDDLVKRQNVDPQEALGKIAEEFVNYDRLAGRFRSYMERMGVLWFWNYKVRITKTAVSMLRNNPLHALMTGLVPTPPLVGNLGLPLEDNFLSMAGDGRLAHSIGPGMGLYGFSLNPWINLLNSVH